MSCLFICPPFFGYYKHIAKEIESRGQKVYWFDDRPSKNFWIKSAIRFYPKLTRFISRRYFENICNEVKDKNIKTIFVIKGESLTLKSISYFRKAFPNSKFIIYFWDSYKNMDSSAPQKAKLFDKAFSFDMRDCEKDANLKYRPLFYIDLYSSISNFKPESPSILFCGSAHTDRYQILNKIKNGLPNSVRFNNFMFFPGYPAYLLKKIFDPSFKSAKAEDFLFTPLPAADLIEKTKMASVVIDIERSVQDGFTIRTLEMLAAERKLITTNSNIINADFYNPLNILLIDRNNPIISENFINTPWQPIDPKIVGKYSISSWLDEILYS